MKNIRKNSNYKQGDVLDYRDIESICSFKK